MAIDLVFDTGASSSFGVANFALGSGSATNYTSMSFSGIEGKTNTMNTTIVTGSLQLAYSGVEGKTAGTNTINYSESLQLTANNSKFAVPSIYLPPNVTIGVSNETSGGIQLVTYPNNPIMFLLN